MKKQVFYAILTISLIPIGIFLIGMKMTVTSRPSDHVPVQIVTDNVAYQQIAQAVVTKNGHVSLFSGNLTQNNEKTIFKNAEVLVTDSHQSQLLTQRRNLKLHSKLLVASDVVKNQTYANYWLSPEIILKTISRLSDLLSDLDPGNRNNYISNSQKLTDQNQALSDGIQALKQEKNVHYIATNNAQQVFMTQLNYTSDIAHIESISNEEFDEIAERIGDKKIRFVLTASQDQSDRDRHLVTLAKNANIPVITFNQVLPSNQKVWQWQLTLVEQLQAVFKPVESGK
ncbi:zinc ABC transporter substrate-binding protein [uncultured Leuconostoc sp.]|uniref:metal ABC transporter solute-binding protein, Zn/Mn family n=1 Tax=uncultured Leuconostoc sp. TaxID=173262 RepID=UPI0025FAE834|nr:zinc ABC transporter substrate-binding protein [uncultured Leuconostoc sp.]